MGKFDKKWNRFDKGGSGRGQNENDKTNDNKKNACLCDRCPLHNPNREYRTRQNSPCHNCGLFGHWATECEQKDDTKRKLVTSIPEGETKVEAKSLN